MAGETLITIIGNLTADPELRQTTNASVVNFTIASTPRTFDRQANDWKDGETLFLNSSAWRDLAEGIAANLRKGQRVIAQGFLKQRTYETKEGEKRTVVEFDVQDIGPAIPRTKPNTQRAGAPAQTNQQQTPRQEATGGWNQPDVWNQPDAPNAYQGGYDPNQPF